MKRAIALSLTLAAAAFTLGGCCRLNGLDAAPSYTCCDCRPATMPAYPTSFSRQGTVNGRHGWYDQNNFFHEGEVPSLSTAGNRGYYDANGGWHSIDEASARVNAGFYDSDGYWHAGSRN